MSKRINRTPWIFDAVGQMEGRDRSGAYPGIADAPFHTVGTFTSATTEITTMTDHGFGKVGAISKCRVTTSASDLPSGLSINTDYWLRVIDRDTFTFFASEAAAQSVDLQGNTNGTPVTIADAGSGTHTLVQQNIFNIPIHISRIKLDTGDGGDFLLTYSTDAGDELVKADSTPANDTLEWPIGKRIEALYVQTIQSGMTFQVWTGDESGEW